MAVKSANVIARVEPEIKGQAEEILERLGLPVSVVINALYRQIILNDGIPFNLTIPRSLPTRDTMSREDFDAMMRTGLSQAKAGKGLELEDAFTKIGNSLA